MLVGGLFFVIALMGYKKYDGLFRALLISAGFHFCIYGFFFDLYRLKFLRKYLLWNFSFSPYKSLILLVSLLPLYSCLVDILIRLIYRKFKKNSS